MEKVGLNSLSVDGDGLLDVVFSGQSGDGDTFRVYKNTGNIQNFAVLEVGLPDIRKSNVDFGDFNDDGYYDILYSGTIQGEGRTTRLAEFNLCGRKILLKMIGMDTFRLRKKWVQIRYPFVSKGLFFEENIVELH